MKEPRKVVQVWYRALLPDGKVWCESSDPKDLDRPGPAGVPLTYQRMTIELVESPWETFTPTGQVDAGAEWCETHQTRHMAPGFGDPEPTEARPPAGWAPPHFYGDPRLAGRGRPVA